MKKKQQFSLFDAPPGPTSFQPPFPDAMDDLNPMATAERDEVNRYLLALDLATKTGWAIHDQSGVKSFATSVKPSKVKRIGVERPNKRLGKLWRWLAMMVRDHGIQVISFEMPFIYHQKKRKPNFTGFEMVGVLKYFCETHNIRLVGYHNKHIKKFATGSGNARKEQVTSAAVARYGITPDDHNEADALHLYHLTVEDLKL